MINSMLDSFLYEEDGQDMVEYALLLGFIGLGAVGLLSGIATQLSGVWSTVNSTLTSTNAVTTPAP
jgi:Flp pilus assembly pilin Flp